MISRDLETFLQSGISVLVGTRDRDLLPECIRGVGARVAAGGTELTVFVPAATASRTLQNVADNGRIAVCFGRPRDHRTIQIKGAVLAVADADDDGDRACIERWREGIARELGWVGVPGGIVRRIAHWPACAIRLQVEAVFEQTPGPGAGDPLRRPAAEAQP